MKINDRLEEEVPSTALPLLRWAGSKKRQFRKLEPFFPKQFKSYVEPFAGSAAFFFGIGPTNAHLNDLNRDVTDFYKRVRKDPLGPVDTYRIHKTMAAIVTTAR